MAISDYSSTPASNTAISGIALGENVMSPADVNNSIRQLMADLAVWYAAGGGGGGGGTGQPLSSVLTAIAALGWAADQMMYATGSSSFALFTSTAFGRSLLGAADAASAASLIGSGGVGNVSGAASSGSVAIGPLTLTWRDFTVSANGNFSEAYGDSHSYSSWARPWVSGDDNSGEASISVTSWTTSSATVHSNVSTSTTCCLFAIGV